MQIILVAQGDTNQHDIRAASPNDNAELLGPDSAVLAPIAGTANVPDDCLTVELREAGSTYRAHRPQDSQLSRPVRAILPS